MRLNPIAATQSGHDYTLRQMAVLALCAQEPRQSVKHYAQTLKMNLAAVTRAQQKLVERNLLLCQKMKADKRLVALSLTPAGRKLVEELTQ